MNARVPRLMAIGLLGIVACAPSDNASSSIDEAARAGIEEALLEMEHAWVAANESGDMTVLDGLFADDFIYTVTDGTLHDKQGFISFAGTNLIAQDSIRLEDLEVRWYGDTPVVTGVGVEYWTEDGVEHRSALRFTNVFVRRDGEWLVAVGHSSSVQ